MMKNVQKKNTSPGVLLVLLCLFLLSAADSCLKPAFAEAKNHLSDIRHWSSPTTTRIVLDLKQEAPGDSFFLKDPDRLVVEMSGFDGTMPMELLNIQDGIVKKVRALQDKEGKVRLIIDLEKPSAHKIFPLKQIDEKPPRLVIDITRLDLEAADKGTREETRKQKKSGDYIIVVDPGHGGEDPGAVSAKGTQEKKLVLEIGKQLVMQLGRIPGVKPYLTRKTDYFIPLQKRIEIANEYGADMFISIHVNAGFSKKVSGSSVYCLSFKGASSNVAKIAAQRENASDVIGGVPSDQQGTGVNAILYDLVQTHTLNSSVQFADMVLAEVAKINKLYTPEPQQANFAVLRSLDIPSVLVETDFISNPEREKYLKTPAFQSEFAQTITAAVKEFLAVSSRQEKSSSSIQLAQASETRPPAPASSGDAAGPDKKQPAAALPPGSGSFKKNWQLASTDSYHVVKKSETEYAIVLHKRGEPEEVASKEKADQKSRAPALIEKKPPPEKTQLAAGAIPHAKPPAAPSVLYHVVQKGETLFSVSKLYNMQIDALRKLNALTPKDELKCGTKIKVVKCEDKSKAENQKPAL